MRVRSRFANTLIFAVALPLVGCGHHARAPITTKNAVAPEVATIHRKNTVERASNPGQYVVQSGDTLHSIAWRFRLDHRELSRWNRILNPDLILVGQKLRLTAPPAKVAAQRIETAKPTRSSSKRSTKMRPKKVRPARPVKWRWPADGKVEAANSALGTKGIKILGRRGAPVRATDAGRIVYSGGGLRGYGKLIIVKHNEEFLSAYAHNERLLKKEGDSVTSGQKIAEMGDSDAKRVMLHFEIRRNGKAVAPLKLLPPR